MARRRRFKRVASSTRRYARKAYKYAGGQSVMGGLIPAFIYGSVRPSAVNLASPVLNMIPAGNFKDNVGMALAGWGMAKFGSGSIRNAGRTILQGEAFLAGLEVGSPLVSGLTSSVVGTTSSNQVGGFKSIYQ